ncbi:cytochrome-c peroxidase [Halodurantibacterium flavum]|uniref:Cytochrome-c peroxidase n=1 Tax=Halodurantibacterium flavum TaxID=1382802 RepID=A0ABW4S0R1_9RHOB
MRKMTRAGFIPALAGALMAAGAVQAQDNDMAFYLDMFEPLPALPPIPADNSLTPEKIELGKMLFFEPRISSSGVISCATCHNPALGWADRIPRAVGHLGQEGSRNTPTVLNAGFLDAQFWDGREATLEGQALGPIAADIEMAMDLDEAVARLQEFETYRAHFAEAFPDDPDPINADNVAQAIASFERTLNTPNSPFDRYLRGDVNAMTEDQVAGMRLFVDVGCVACHNGPALSDSNFHVFDAPGSEDDGRFVVTGDDFDRGAFRTPTLRNVAVTYPYFNNGSVESLHEAVFMMGDQMTGYDFSDDELDQVVAFLHALTGEMPAVMPPALP